MELTFLQIADYANITADQKLNVMGIFAISVPRSFLLFTLKMSVVTQLKARAVRIWPEFHFDR